MKPSIQKLLYSALLLAAFVMALSHSAYGQESQAQDDSTEIVEARSLQLVEIPAEAVATRNMVNLARERIRNAGDFNALKQKIDEETETYDRDIAIYETFRKGTPNRQKLQSEVSIWYIARETRSNWQRTIENILTTAEASRQQLSEELQLWQRTLSSANAQNAPESLIQSIQKNIELIQQVLIEANTITNEALDLSARISDQYLEISSILDDLDLWRHSGELNVMYKRHEAIWNTDFTTKDGAPEHAEWYTLQDKWDGLLIYLRDYSSRIVKFVLIFLLISLAIYLVRYRSIIKIDWKLYELDKERFAVIERPNTTILFTTMVLAIFYFSSLPDFFAQLVLLTFVISSHFALQPFLLPRYRNIILFIALAFIINDAKTHLWFTSANYRLYLYMEAILGLALISYFTIPYSKIRSLPPTKINRTIVFGTLVLICLYLTAIIGDTLGYTNLADLTLRLSVRSTLISVMALGFIYVIGGALQVAITLAMAEHEKYDHATIASARKQSQNVIFWVVACYWAVLILNSAELLNPLAGAVMLWLTEPWTIQDFAITPGNILFVLIIVILAIVVTKAVAVIIESGFLGYFRAKQGTLNIVSMVLRYIVVVFAFIIALKALGMDLNKFGLMAGALGVGIGFGLQNIVASFIAGMVLVFERPMIPGDTIEIDGVLGVVQKVSVRSTKIKSFDGADITIPNSTMLSHNLINWTQDNSYKRLEVNVGVAYGTDPKKVQDIMLETVTNHPGVENHPPPIAVFDVFGDSSIDFRLLFWVHIESVLRVKSEISITLYDRLNAEGIEIPFPQQDVHVRQQ